MEQLYNEPASLYQRNFGKGFVLINPSLDPVERNFPYPVLLLTIECGGNIATDGQVMGGWCIAARTHCSRIRR